MFFVFFFLVQEDSLKQVCCCQQTTVEHLAGTPQEIVRVTGQVVVISVVLVSSSGNWDNHRTYLKGLLYDGSECL